MFLSGLSFQTSKSNVLLYGTFNICFSRTDYDQSLCLLISLQIFKSHPLILNYDHLNSSIEDPWHPIVEETVLFDNATGNKTVEIITIKPPYPNTALLSMCLMLGCFFIAYFLRQFKNGTFLPGRVSRRGSQSPFADCFSKDLLPCKECTNYFKIFKAVYFYFISISFFSDLCFPGQTFDRGLWRAYFHFPHDPRGLQH